MHNITKSFWGNPAADLILRILPCSSCKLVITAGKEALPFLLNTRTIRSYCCFCKMLCVCHTKVNKIEDLHLWGKKQEVY